MGDNQYIEIFYVDPVMAKTLQIPSQGSQKRRDASVDIQTGFSVSKTEKESSKLATLRFGFENVCWILKTSGCVIVVGTSCVRVWLGILDWSISNDMQQHMYVPENFQTAVQQSVVHVDNLLVVRRLHHHTTPL
jgi:hypothetical protein